MEAGQADDTGLSPFVRFSREEWGRLLAATSFSVSEEDVRDLRRISEHLSSEEATKVYLPLSWLLYLHVSATQDLFERLALPEPFAERGSLIGASDLGANETDWGM